ncbi:hypothetical protein SANTM175S_07608 [Streptomyces antimycoticus]
MRRALAATLRSRWRSVASVRPAEVAGRRSSPDHAVLARAVVPPSSRSAVRTARPAVRRPRRGRRRHPYKRARRAAPVRAALRDPARPVHRQAHRPRATPGAAASRWRARRADGPGSWAATAAGPPSLQLRLRRGWDPLTGCAGCARRTGRGPARAMIRWAVAASSCPGPTCTAAWRPGDDEPSPGCVRPLGRLLGRRRPAPSAKRVCSASCPMASMPAPIRQRPLPPGQRQRHREHRRAAHATVHSRTVRAGGTCPPTRPL